MGQSLSGASATNSATFGFTDTNDTGSGSTYTQTTPALTVPGLLVNLPLPDGSSVPVVGADESSGGIPVSSPDLGMVGALSEWLYATGSSAQAVTQPNATMPMEPQGMVGAPTQSPAAHPPLNGAALTPAGSGPAIQNVAYQENNEGIKTTEPKDVKVWVMARIENLAKSALPEGESYSKYARAPLEFYYKQWSNIRYNKNNQEARNLWVGFWNRFAQEYEDKLRESMRAYDEWIKDTDAKFAAANNQQRTKVMADMWNSLWANMPQEKRPSFEAFAKRRFGDKDATGITKEQFELAIGSLFYDMFIQSMEQKLKGRAKDFMNNKQAVKIVFGDVENEKRVSKLHR